MNNLNDLYQDLIIDHSRDPRNYFEMSQSSCQAKGYNPLCGDQLTLYLKFENDRIIDASFTGCGCAISTSSASLMTEALKGKTKAEASTLFQHFHALVTEGSRADNTLGKLNVLSGVNAFPSRVKCATLAWHTLKSALKNSDQITCTET